MGQFRTSLCLSRPGLPKTAVVLGRASSDWGLLGLEDHFKIVYIAYHYLEADS